MNKQTKETIRELEDLSITTDPGNLDRAYTLFVGALQVLEMTYFMPGEPVAECAFCGASRPLPGVHGEDVYTSDELETDCFELDDNAYWARVWAIRALDLLDPQYVIQPCCERNEKLLTRLGIL